MFCHDLASRSMEIPSPTVIAQPLPGREHLLLICLGQRPHGGKTPYKGWEVLQDTADLGLLQHEL
jgi:hypothetical protein